MLRTDALRLLRSTGETFSVIEHEVGMGFGDELVTVTDGSVAFRIIRDRGQLLLDVRPTTSKIDWVDASAVAKVLGKSMPSVFPTLEVLVDFIARYRHDLRRVLSSWTAESGGSP